MTMINDSVAINAQSVGADLASKGIVLNAMPNTFLDTLLTLLKNHEALHKPSQEGISVHFHEDPSAMFCAVMDDLAISGGEVVMRGLNLARTDASELIRRVMETVEETVNPKVPYAYTRMAVEVFTWPEIWASDFIRSVASTNRLGDMVDMMPRGIVLSDEEVYHDFVKLSATGLAPVDKMVGEILSRWNTQKLEGLFRDVFQEGQLQSARVVGCDVDYLDRIVLTYLWATKLKDTDYFPSRSNFDKYDYLDKLATITASMGKLISVLLERREVQAKAQRLVLDAFGEKVVVNGDLYSEWLNKGGRPEIMLGAGVLGSEAIELSGDELIAQADRFLKTWNSHVAVVEAKQRTDMRSTVRAELFRVVKNLIVERKAKGMLDDEGAAIDALDSFLRAVDMRLESVAYYVRDLVCSVFYSQTDVHQILCIMDRLHSEDKDLAADDAATLATIEYVCSFAAKYIIPGKF